MESSEFVFWFVCTMAAIILVNCSRIGFLERVLAISKPIFAEKTTKNDFRSIVPLITLVSISSLLVGSLLNLGEIPMWMRFVFICLVLFPEVVYLLSRGLYFSLMRDLGNFQTEEQCSPQPTTQTSSTTQAPPPRDEECRGLEG